MAKGLVQLGEAHVKLGQDKQARSAYERALSADENCSEAHFQLGTLLQRCGQDAEALKAFASAVKAAAVAAASGPDSGAREGSREAFSSFLS
ncbi:unnamed protein product [Ectocarpus sp. 12 AP-2014]